jgi:hypothetical protein
MFKHLKEIFCLFICTQLMFKNIPHSNNVFQIFEFIVHEGAFGAISGIWGIQVFTLDWFIRLICLFHLLITLIKFVNGLIPFIIWIHV